MVLFKGAEGEYKNRWPVNTFEPGLFPIVYTSRHSFGFQSPIQLLLLNVSTTDLVVQGTNIFIRSD
jgi:hypothetical protein